LKIMEGFLIFFSAKYARAPQSRQGYRRFDAENRTFSNRFLNLNKLFWRNFKYISGILGASS
jgi:hypothetical protein